MKNRTLRLFITLLISLSLAYTPLLRADQLSLPSGDLIAPTVKHEPIKNKPTAGLSQKFSATVTDNVGVQSVVLFYRKIGEQQYRRKAMKRVGKTDEFMVVLGAQEVEAPGIEYYIQASDLAGNNLLHGYSFSPLIVNVAAAPAKSAEPAEPEDQVVFEPEEKQTNKWIWIGLGVLAVAAAAGGGGGGGGGGTSTATLTITASEPGN